MGRRKKQLEMGIMHRNVSNCFLVWKLVIKMLCSELLLSFLRSERRMKPLLPRTDSYLVPIQLPVTSSVYLSSSSAQFPPSCSQQKPNTSRGAKRVRIAPKVKTLSRIAELWPNPNAHLMLFMLFWSSRSYISKKYLRFFNIKSHMGSALKEKYWLSQGRFCNANIMCWTQLLVEFKNCVAVCLDRWHKVTSQPW